MLKTTRRILAVLMFLGITALYVDPSGQLRLYIGWMAKLQLLPAALALNVGVLIALVLITLLFGRIYCSVICPLGVLQDFIARIRKLFKLRYSYSKPKTWLRLTILAITIIAIVLGVNSVVAILGPYSSYGRMVSSIMHPTTMVVIVAAISFALVATLAMVGGRTYCNTICPVGTALGLIARFSRVRIFIDASKCKNCKACEKSCKSACIDLKSHTIDTSRCVVCGDCLSKCKFDAIHHGIPKRVVAPVDKGRRAFLIGSAIAATTAALAQEKKKVDGGLAVVEDKIAPERKTPITPPGSISAQNMAHHCTACQLCITACPNNVLRPATSIEHFMQPHSSFEIGYCRPECTRCSEVCPTGAIRKISREEKAVTQTGHAVWLKWNCVPIADGVPCGNCARHCPTGAIQMIPLEEVKDEDKPAQPVRRHLEIPIVNEALCIGCGACENLCPARPLSAIYVEGHEQHSLTI